MCKKKSPEYLRAAQTARYKVELASGIRTDRRFVGKTIPNKWRKKRYELDTHEIF